MNQFAIQSDAFEFQHELFVDEIKPELTYEQITYIPLKRLIDFTASLIGLIICLPFFLITAIAIKLDSPGPVFFRQERVGKYGKAFFIYKFRSMVADAEILKDNLYELNESNGPFFKIMHDPRVTKVGKFIRKYSIDELPQLWNVLIGDMSLVGPRPALFNEIELYDKNQLKNLSVNPGLTCYWQISGRSESADNRIALDAKYIQEFNPLIDFMILLRTPVVVLMGKGAC